MTRTRAAWELSAALFVLELHFWTDSKLVLPAWGRTATSAIAAFVLVGLLIRQKPTLEQVGVRPTKWTAGFRSLVLFVLVASLIVLLLGWTQGSVGMPRDFLHWMKRGWYLQLAQQILLNVFLAPRIRLILGETSAWRTTAAAVFGLLHLPNPLLTPLTFLAGIFWVHWFERYRNLPAAWVSHFILGAMTFYCLDSDLLRRMRVGVGYLTFPN